MHDYRVNVRHSVIERLHLMGKETTQKEFLKIFEPMCKCGKQIVVACDKYFENESALTDEMRNFFVSGLSSEIKLPDKA